jgi:hypothetical protein
MGAARPAVAGTTATILDPGGILSLQSWLEQTCAHPICVGDPGVICCARTRGRVQDSAEYGNREAMLWSVEKWESKDQRLTREECLCGSEAELETDLLHRTMTMFALNTAMEMQVCATERTSAKPGTVTNSTEGTS